MIRSTILLMTAACLLAACAPTLRAPEPEVPDRYLGSDDPDGRIPYDIAWWRAFDDPTLDSLVRRAIRQNRNLEEAVSRTESARYNLSLVKAQYLPQIGLDLSAAADYAAETKIEQSYAIKPALTWEVSLFGELRHAKRAARANLLASEWALRGVILSLSAEVATTYFTLREYECDLAIARESHRLRQESAALIDSMFRYGMSDGVALEQARSLVYTAAADIASYGRSVVQTRLTLRTLLGEDPQPADTCTLAGCERAATLPAEVPAGLPSDLLERRPDIMQAYYVMQQAAAEAGVARSQRFPAVSLTAAGGVAADAIGGLTSGKPWVGSAAASLTQPIFGFGQLKRRERIACETYRQQALAYEQSFIEALAEVEQALTAVATYRQQTEESARLVEANRRIAEMTQALYRSGLNDYLSVIDAERSLYNSQMEETGLRTQQRIAYVDLFKALGGGW